MWARSVSGSTPVLQTGGRSSSLRRSTARWGSSAVPVGLISRRSSVRIRPEPDRAHRVRDALQRRPCRVRLLGAVLERSACRHRQRPAKAWAFGSREFDSRPLRDAVGAGRAGACKAPAFGHARFDPWTPHGGFGLRYAARSRKAYGVTPGRVRLSHPPLSDTSQGIAKPVFDRRDAAHGVRLVSECCDESIMIGITTTAAAAPRSAKARSKSPRSSRSQPTSSGATAAQP